MNTISMPEDLRRMLERQAAWQRSRAALPWAEKLRQALILRQAALALRRPGPGPTPSREWRHG